MYPLISENKDYKFYGNELESGLTYGNDYSKSEKEWPNYADFGRAVKRAGFIFWWGEIFNG